MPHGDGKASVAQVGDDYFPVVRYVRNVLPCASKKDVDLMYYAVVLEVMQEGVRCHAYDATGKHCRAIDARRRVGASTERLN